MPSSTESKIPRSEALSMVEVVREDMNNILGPLEATAYHADLTRSERVRLVTAYRAVTDLMASLAPTLDRFQETLI